MTSIEICIGKQKYVVRGDESEEHLREVTELVRRKVESLRKSDPSLSLQRAAMLAAFDFASECIKGKKRSAGFRASVVAKAQEMFDRVQTELGGAQGQATQ